MIHEIIYYENEQILYPYMLRCLYYCIDHVTHFYTIFINFGWEFLNSSHSIQIYRLGARIARDATERDRIGGRARPILVAIMLHILQKLRRFVCRKLDRCCPRR